MLATAKNILLSEMILSEDLSHDVLDNKIEEAIKYSFSVGNDTNIGTENIDTPMVMGKVSLD